MNLNTGSVLTLIGDLHAENAALRADRERLIGEVEALRQALAERDDSSQ